MHRRHLYFPVAAPPGAQWPNWYVAGWLTVPAKPLRSELQILLHGACYDHRYWDWPEQPQRYSYAAWSEKRGIATLALDRIGCGFSTRPPGRESTLAAQSAVLGQIIDLVRSGLAELDSVERIVLIGHSLGSLIAGHHAATHADVDAVVLTGYLPVEAASDSEERLLDRGFLRAIDGCPRLLGLVDQDYLVPHPNMREPLMYSRNGADPKIMEVDEDIKGTTTRGELVGSGSAGPVIRTSAIPTLVMVGQYDRLLMKHGVDRDCRDTAKRVAAISPENFRYVVVDNNGHNLNLHRDARRTYSELGRWLDEGAR